MPLTLTVKSLVCFCFRQESVDVDEVTPLQNDHGEALVVEEKSQEELK